MWLYRLVSIIGLKLSLNLLNSVEWRVVKIIRLLTDRARRLAIVFTTIILKYYSIWLMPLKKKHILRTRSKFKSILLIKKVLTIVIWPLVRAKIETINSTAFLRQILDNIRTNKKRRNIPKSYV